MCSMKESSEKQKTMLEVKFSEVKSDINVVNSRFSEVNTNICLLYTSRCV